MSSSGDFLSCGVGGSSFFLFGGEESRRGGGMNNKLDFQVAADGQTRKRRK